MDWQSETQAKVINGDISLILHNCLKTDKLKQINISLICDTYQMDTLHLLPLFNDNYTQSRDQYVYIWM